MIALTAAPPLIFKRMLELYGLQLVEETKYHWGFYWPQGKQIISLPKKGQLVSMRVKENICQKLIIDLQTFVDLYNRATSAEATGRPTSPPK